MSSWRVDTTSPRNPPSPPLTSDQEAALRAKADPVIVGMLRHGSRGEEICSFELGLSDTANPSGLADKLPETAKVTLPAPKHPEKKVRVECTVAAIRGLLCDSDVTQICLEPGWARASPRRSPHAHEPRADRGGSEV